MSARPMNIGCALEENMVVIKAHPLETHYSCHAFDVWHYRATAGICKLLWEDPLHPKVLHLNILKPRLTSISEDIDPNGDAAANRDAVERGELEEEDVPPIFEDMIEGNWAYNHGCRILGVDVIHAHIIQAVIELFDIYDFAAIYETLCRDTEDYVGHFEDYLGDHECIDCGDGMWINDPCTLHDKKEEEDDDDDDNAAVDVGTR